MANLQTDMGAVRDIGMQIQTVHDSINDIRILIGRLRENRKQLEATKILSYEEYISDLKRTYGHSVDAESETIRKKYEMFRDTTARKQDELKAQLEQARGQLKSKFVELDRKLQEVLNEHMRIGAHLKQAASTTAHAKEELEHPTANIGLEQISGMDREVRDIYWNKDEF